MTGCRCIKLPRIRFDESAIEKQTVTSWSVVEVKETSFPLVLVTSEGEGGSDYNDTTHPSQHHNLQNTIDTKTKTTLRCRKFPVDAGRAQRRLKHNSQHWAGQRMSASTLQQVELWRLSFSQSCINLLLSPLPPSSLLLALLLWWIFGIKYNVRMSVTTNDKGQLVSDLDIWSHTPNHIHIWSQFLPFNDFVLCVVRNRNIMHTL